MRVYFIAVKGDHPEERHEDTLRRLSLFAVCSGFDVERAWMEEMSDPVDLESVARGHDAPAAIPVDPPMTRSERGEDDDGMICT